MKNKDYREYIENRSDQLMGIDISLKQFLVNVLNILEKNEHGINPDEFTLMIERSLNGSSDIAIETFKIVNHLIYLRLRIRFQYS